MRFPFRRRKSKKQRFTDALLELMEKWAKQK